MEAKEDASQQGESIERRTAVLLGLAIGDCLGSTSEFQIPWYYKEILRLL